MLQRRFITCQIPIPAMNANASAEITNPKQAVGGAYHTWTV